MNDIEASVLRTVGESTTNPDVFTDDELGMAPVRDSINEAIEEVAMLTGGSTETFRVPLRKGVSHYRVSMPQGHFGWLINAWRLDGKLPLEVITSTELRNRSPEWLTQTGYPRCVFQVGLDVVGMWPRPAGATEMIEIRAAVIPAEYKLDTDRIKVRAEYERALVNFAVAEYWAGRGDAASAATYFSEYIKVLGNRLVSMEAPDRVYTYGRDRAPEALPS